MQLCGQTTPLCNAPSSGCDSKTPRRTALATASAGRTPPLLMARSACSTIVLQETFDMPANFVNVYVLRACADYYHSTGVFTSISTVICLNL